ncbi:MAG: hypothetical protein JSW34_00235 [Candidatus Zixiibacteriota bacterium]|nr:MAG: hypothetical protein JSW34_00235 [candidate division Zixibacteria bacterium]
MLKALLILALCLPLSVAAGQNQPAEQFGIEHLMEYLGMVPGDISFRSDYTEPDSFRLQVVSDLMTRPLDMIAFSTEVKNGHINGQPEIMARYLFKQAARTGQAYRDRAYRADAAELQGSYNLFYNDMTFNQILTRAAAYIDVIIPRSAEKSLAFVTSDQRRFLRDQFKQLLVISESEEFLSVAAADSLEKLENSYCEQFAAFGHRINKDPVIDAGVECLREILMELNTLRAMLKSGAVSAEKIVEGTGYLPGGADLDAYLGKQTGWKVGGPGNDYYNGDYKFIFDFGGDDIYDLSYDPSDPHGVIIIDLSGNDVYRALSDFALGSGCFSVGLLLDFEGDDTYDARSFGLGSGYFGLGILYDAAGNDHYDGDTHVQGAGTFGIGLLIDEGGRDIYNAALYSQGFGFSEGVGVVYDLAGSDSYYAGGKYKAVIHYDDHYESNSQGCGYGIRPYLSGGIGALIDLKGHDNYHSDMITQGAGFWWALGMVYDSSGNDRYTSFQYAQGSGTHMALGILVDGHGDDVYFGKGLMQGCGHDYACGLILDRSGSDTYTAFDLSQGAGSANGAGLLIDNGGDDLYSVRRTANTRGYGNPRRDFGSIGLFIDLGGTDQYHGGGQDNFYWRSDSKWGGGMDIELHPPDTTGSKM